MNPRRIFLAGLLSLGAAGLLFTLHRMDEGTIDVVAASEAAPRYTLFDTEWTRFDEDGQRSIIGVAETMVYFSDESGRASNIVVDVLDFDGGTWKLAAPTAILPAKQKRIELLGNVDIAGQWPDSGEPLRARTDEVWVDPDTHHIHSEDFIEVDSRSRSGTAVGFESDWDKKSLQLLHDVKMVYTVPAR